MSHSGLHNRLLVYLHTAVIYVGTIIVTIIFGILAIIVSFFSRSGNSVHLVARFWARSILWISLIPVKIRGLENIDTGRSYIYMSNHQSNFDIPVLLSELPVQFRWLAKAELFRIPIFGRGMRGAGYISIDRSNRKSAFQSLTRAAESIRAGTSVLIFPEGTRSPDGRLQPFKKGGFMLAVDAGVPVVPIIVRGTFDIMAKSGWAIRRQQVIVDILPPVDASRYTRKEKDELIEKCHLVMSGAMHAEGLGDDRA
jgi:1-acyl-sn-glycerol-3-phosphate acyltransferase